MAATYPFGSAQKHIPICEKHDLTKDITCEDCGEFICSECARTYHKDHDLKTISEAGMQWRRELNVTLSKVKEEDVKKMEEKTQKVDKKRKDNHKYCAFNRPIDYFEVMSKLNKIRKIIEKNDAVREKKSDLEKKTKQV